jgi:hypothetical protein
MSHAQTNADKLSSQLSVKDLYCMSRGTQAIYNRHLSLLAATKLCLITPSQYGQRHVRDMYNISRMDTQHSSTVHEYCNLDRLYWLWGSFSGF